MIGFNENQNEFEIENEIEGRNSKTEKGNKVKMIEFEEN